MSERAGTRHAVLDMPGYRRMLEREASASRARDAAGPVEEGFAGLRRSADRADAWAARISRLDDDGMTG